jgi:cell division protein FtsI/penicillin-binding protein 2
LDKDKYRDFDKRIGCLQFCFLAFIVSFLIYLFLLQIFDIRHYKERAKTQRASKIFVLRGEILDRNGFKLAVDETSFDVYAHRKYYDYPPEVWNWWWSPTYARGSGERVFCDKGANSPD